MTGQRSQLAPRGTVSRADGAHPRKGNLAVAKCKWIEAISIDPALTAFQVRVAAIIAKHVNSETERTFVGHTTIARLAAAKVRSDGVVQTRGVELAIAQLEAMGYLKADRGNGKHNKTEYTLNFEHTERANSGSPFTPSKGRTGNAGKGERRFPSNLLREPTSGPGPAATRKRAGPVPPEPDPPPSASPRWEADRRIVRELMQACSNSQAQYAELARWLPSELNASALAAEQERAGSGAAIILDAWRQFRSGAEGNKPKRNRRRSAKRTPGQRELLPPHPLPSHTGPDPASDPGHDARSEQRRQRATKAA